MTVAICVAFNCVSRIYLGAFYIMLSQLSLLVIWRNCTGSSCLQRNINRYIIAEHTHINMPTCICIIYLLQCCGLLRRMAQFSFFGEIKSPFFHQTILLRQQHSQVGIENNQASRVPYWEILWLDTCIICFCQQMKKKIILKYKDIVRHDRYVRFESQEWRHGDSHLGEWLYRVNSTSIPLRLSHNNVLFRFIKGNKFCSFVFF